MYGARVYGKSLYLPVTIVLKNPNHKTNSQFSLKHIPHHNVLKACNLIILPVILRQMTIMNYSKVAELWLDIKNFYYPIINVIVNY